MPEYILFSALGGFFTLSLKNCFPQRIESIDPGLKLADFKKPPNVIQLDIEEKLRKKLASRLLKWNELITFDRRKDFSQFNYDEKALINNIFRTIIDHEMFLDEQ